MTQQFSDSLSSSLIEDLNLTLTQASNWGINPPVIVFYQLNQNFAAPRIPSAKRDAEPKEKAKVRKYLVEKDIHGEKTV